MNTLSKERQLQKRISEILEPNLEDRLVFGCEIYDKYQKETLTITKPNYNNDKLRVQIQNNGLLDFNFGQNDCNVLGLPINLERLLLAIPKTETHIIGLTFFTLNDTINIRLPYTPSNNCTKWILNKTFNEQSQETQEALYKLFNIE